MINHDDKTDRRALLAAEYMAHKRVIIGVDMANGADVTVESHWLDGKLVGCAPADTVEGD